MCKIENEQIIEKKISEMKTLHTYTSKRILDYEELGKLEKNELKEEKKIFDKKVNDLL